MATNVGHNLALDGLARRKREKLYDVFKLHLSTIKIENPHTDFEVRSLSICSTSFSLVRLENCLSELTCLRQVCGSFTLNSLLCKMNCPTCIRLYCVQAAYFEIRPKQLGVVLRLGHVHFDVSQFH